MLSKLYCPNSFLSQLRPSLLVVTFSALGRSGISRSYSTFPKTFDKILIANRGEIACRIIRTAKKMGIKTVAVYSEADANSLHVRMADESYFIGPSPTSKSYLNMENILKAAKDSGAQAVHPGFGFLSENPKFCDLLTKSGIVFIGPAVSSMESMSNKIGSKQLAKSAGVHTIPGFNGQVKDESHAREIANQIGYPVMVKASCGGGGKGMRVAWNDSDLKDGYRLAKAEAKSSFGDDTLLVEKFIDNPRHVEIQIIGDQFGNTLYLPERECSIQRRNQKVIEEAPSVALDQKTRDEMGKQAVSLAKKVGYFSAGTVEFLVDSQRNFYFLEMNTRLQVEHPITELITGIDLVEQMIKVAAKQRLELKQEDIKINGWALECRVYAEDPEKYLPCIGTLTKYIEPEFKLEEGEKVRCDSGIVEGSEISIFYDPMICKLSTHSNNRDGAIEVMAKALDHYVIQGVTHNIPLLREVIKHNRFTSGNISTKFLAEEYPDGFKGHKLEESNMKELLAVATAIHLKREYKKYSIDESYSDSYVIESPLFLTVNRGEVTQVTLHFSEESIKVEFEDKTCVAVDIDWPLESSIVEATVDGKLCILQYLERRSMGFRLQYFGSKFDITVMNEDQSELFKHMIPKAKVDLSKVVLSPMPGTVVSLAVKPGDKIAQGTEVAVVEAMKMQNVLRSSKGGIVKSVNVKEGQSVAADEVLLEIEDIK